MRESRIYLPTKSILIASSGENEIKTQVFEGDGKRDAHALARAEMEIQCCNAMEDARRQETIFGEGYDFFLEDDSAFVCTKEDPEPPQRWQIVDLPSEREKMIEDQSRDISEVLHNKVEDFIYSGQICNMEEIVKDILTKKREETLKKAERELKMLDIKAAGEIMEEISKALTEKTGIQMNKEAKEDILFALDASPEAIDKLKLSIEEECRPFKENIDVDKSEEEEPDLF